MKRIRLLTAIGVAASVLMASVPCYAETYNNAASGSIAVTAVVSSTYSITLPASLTLELTEGNTYAKDYTVGVMANLQDNEKITVIPDATFEMTSTNPDSSAEATVTQPITVWKNIVTDNATQIGANRTQYVNTTGTISVDLVNAGSYSGSAEFTFAKVTE